MSDTKESLWESTAVQNLIRYRPSGTYFGRFRVGGKLVRQSLETAVFSVAKQRLPDKIREYRSRHESVKAFAGGKITVGDAVEVYRGKVRANASLKPRSKDYREMTLDFIERSWPSLFETDVRKVSERDCENWLIRFQQQYAPTVVNNSIGTLRAVFRDRGDENQRALRTKSTCATKTTSVHRYGDDVMRSDGRSQFSPRNCRSPVSTSAEAVFRRSRRAFPMSTTRHCSI
jgi:hypothetical protein